MANLRCSEKYWDESEAQWQCKLNGYCCVDGKEPREYSALCPDMRTTPHPCPECLGQPQSKDEPPPRLKRMVQHPTSDLICPTCGHKTSAHQCVEDLLYTL